MDPRIIILVISAVVYIPLATLLLYVWHKYGSGERGVRYARIIFLLGSVILFWYMITL